MKDAVDLLNNRIAELEAQLAHANKQYKKSSGDILEEDIPVHESKIVDVTYPKRREAGE